MSTIRASIDLGTNTCLLLVVKWDNGRIEEVLGDFATVVRLGQGVDQSRVLHPEAIGRTLTCLKRYADELKQLGGDPSQCICVATSQARDAKNGSEFFLRVSQETGFNFKVISGDEEARLSFEGALLPGMDSSRAVIIDIGGGSTEFVSKAGGRSLDLGSVRFTERYLKSNPVTDQEFWSCQSAIDAEIVFMKQWRAQLKQPNLIGVAGTVTTLAAWHLGLTKFDSEKVSQCVLSRGDVHRMVEELKWRTTAERQTLAGVDAGRADVLLAGALILWRSMELLDFSEVRVSARGLRYGVLGLV